MASNTATLSLSEAIVTAVAQLVDDSQAEERRDPSHSDLSFQIQRAGLTKYDPKSQGQNVGKAKRLRFVLSSAMDHDLVAGDKLVRGILDLIRGYGGFRSGSPNYVTSNAIKNAIAAFRTEGYDLSADGELRPLMLDSLSTPERFSALASYAHRAQRGAEDAALVAGTGKDLLEATAAYVLQERYGRYSQQTNFPTLLGQAFLALGMATPEYVETEAETPMRSVERSMYELARAINKLRNKEGTGHGRPWLPDVSVAEAKAATECMGAIAAYMLARQAETTKR